MAGVRTKGIVIKQSDFGEGDRMLWIFTEDFGIIKAVGRGSRKLKSKSGSSLQFLCYGEFDFFCGGEIWNVNSFSPEESFEPLQYDFKKLALCNYLAELTFVFLDLANPDKLTLRLFLNTLFACAYKDIPLNAIKLIFEFKLLCFNGYTPHIENCVFCGSSDISAFSVSANGCVCKSCELNTSIKIEDESLSFLKYILCCDIKKMFAYKIPENVISELSYICERYILHHADREIKSLNYYKTI